MSEELKVAAAEDRTGVSSVEEFYVHRINWLITLGRYDLVDEIADDYERRRAALRPPNAVHPGREQPERA
jgi:hypothetical protein